MGTSNVNTALVSQTTTRLINRARVGESRRLRPRRGAFQVLAAAIDSATDADIEVDDIDNDSDFDLGKEADESDEESSDADTIVETAQPSQPAAASPAPAEEPRAAGNWVEVEPSDDAGPSHDITFQARNPGPREAPPRNADPLSYFSLFVGEDILSHVVRETNRYARLMLETEYMQDWIERHPHSRFKRKAGREPEPTALHVMLGATWSASPSLSTIEE